MKIDTYYKKLSYNINLDELRLYYHQVEKEYQHLKWSSEYISDTIDHEKHSVNGLYGWAIQSNLDNLNIPCPPYHIHKNGSDTYRNTELVFGFAAKLLQRYPYARQMGIAVHPKGIIINQHIDNVEYVKIHIPIYATSASYFCFYDEKIILEPGYAYLIDTRHMHGTIQEGDGMRAHLFFKIPTIKIEDVLC